MFTMSTMNLRENLHDYVHRAEVDGERFIVTRYGKPVAAIVPIEDAEFLQELEDRFDQAEAEKAYLEMEEHPPIPWEEVKRSLNL